MEEETQQVDVNAPVTPTPAPAPTKRIRAGAGDAVAVTIHLTADQYAKAKQAADDDERTVPQFLQRAIRGLDFLS